METYDTTHNNHRWQETEAKFLSAGSSDSTPGPLEDEPAPRTEHDGPARESARRTYISRPPLNRAPRARAAGSRCAAAP